MVGQVTAHTGAEKLPEALYGCALVVIPAGVPRKPGMTRDDLFNINASAHAAAVLPSPIPTPHLLASLSAPFAHRSISATCRCSHILSSSFPVHVYTTACKFSQEQGCSVQDRPAAPEDGCMNQPLTSPYQTGAWHAEACAAFVNSRSMTA